MGLGVFASSNLWTAPMASIACARFWRQQVRNHAPLVSKLVRGEHSHRR